MLAFQSVAGRGSLPGLPFVVGQPAELLGIQPQIFAKGPLFDESHHMSPKIRAFAEVRKSQTELLWAEAERSSLVFAPSIE